MKHTVSPSVVQQAPSRPPWSRELFLILRLSGCHPIVWHRDAFVVSGIGFVLYGYLISAVFLLCALTRCLWPHMVPARKLPPEFSHNPITVEIHAFFFVEQMSFQLGGGFFIIAFILQREKIAVVFNLLNELWLW